jgi:hypothetical protein
MKPRRAATEFKSGIAKLYATFDVRGAQEGSSATVRWLRSGASFDEQQLELAPEGRFGAELAAPNGLPDGAYSVEVFVDGAEAVTAEFTVGDPAVGPRVDKLELGHALGDDNLPTAATTIFARGDDAVRCGLRFLDLPAGAELALQWLAVAEDGATTLLHTTRNAVPDGGSGTLGAEWRQPDGGFEPGSYKVVVVAGEQTLAEVGFTVE